MTIDLNADVGEGVGNDAQLMPFLSSCNIACGVHAGGTDTIADTIGLAILHNVKIGAHPSFPDRNNFGRKEMELPQQELVPTIIDQIELVKNTAENLGTQLHHVKPHGALYNMAAHRADIAFAIVSAMHEFKSTALYVPFGSVIAALAKREGITICYEAFADRNYNDDLTLVSRKNENAMLHDPTVIAAHAIRMIRERKVKTINGNFVPIEAETICIHGDNPHAVEIAQQLHSKFGEVAITIG